MQVFKVLAKFTQVMLSVSGKSTNDKIVVFCGKTVRDVINYELKCEG